MIILGAYIWIARFKLFSANFNVDFNHFLCFFGVHKFCAVASRILKRAKKKDLKGDEKMRFLAKLENFGGKVAFLPSIDKQLLIIIILIFCCFKGKSYLFKDNPDYCEQSVCMVLSSVSNLERAIIMKRERIDLMSTKYDLCDDKERPELWRQCW